MGGIGQVFTSIQGEGLYVGRRQVFIRFSGCPLSCIYCDTPEFRKPVDTTAVETSPGSGRFRRLTNVTPAEILSCVRNLLTPDVHSISLTGGEPLTSPELLLGLLRGMRELKTYLETAGTDPSTMKKACHWLDFASIDVKLPDHRAVRSPIWPDLFEREMECIRSAIDGGVEAFAKIVILSTTNSKVFRRVCKRLSKIGVPLVLQPVTPVGGVSPPSSKKILTLSSLASSEGLEVAVIPQVHKIMGFP